MDELLKTNCDKMSDYRNGVLQKLFWATAPNEEAMMCALLHIAAGKDLKTENYDACKAILKNNAGIFSEFRGMADTLVITKMMLQENPEEYLKGVMSVYKKIIERHRWSSSAYTVMAAINIYEKGQTENTEYYLDRLDTLYKKLKEEHHWLVSNEDYGYLSMLICSDKDPDAIAADTEKAYQVCRDITLDKDGAYSLAQVLSLTGEKAETGGAMAKEIIALMKEKGHPLSRYEGLSALGALSMLSLSKEEIVNAICETDDYLKTKKGFRMNGAKFRRTMASLLVFITYSGKDEQALAGHISSVLTMQIVEEIIMLLILMMINASAAAHASSR